MKVAVKNEVSLLESFSRSPWWKGWRRFDNPAGGAKLRSGPPHEPRYLYLHVGAHKTATTSLQAILRANTDELAARSIVTFARSKPRMRRSAEMDANAQLKRAIAKLRKKKQGIRKRKAAVRALRKCVVGVGGRAQCIVLSDESMFGGLQNLQPRLYDSAEDVLGGFRSAFPHHRLRVILYIRDQDSFIESMYMQMVHQGNFELPFGEFMEKHVNLHALSWMDLAERIVGVVGEENLSVRRFETIRDGFEPFARDFLRHFTDPQGIRIIAQQRNPSLSATGLAIALRMGPLLPFGRRKFSAILQRHFSVAHGQAPPRLLDDETRRTIRQLYEGDVDRTARRFHGWSG